MRLPTITISSSILSGNYREHRAYARLLADVIKERFKDIRKHMILPRNLFIRLRPIRNIYGSATTEHIPLTSYGKNYIVEVDVRQDFDSFKDTLLHELVHIEQFYAKRLGNSSKAQCFKWKGKDIETVKPSCDEEYTSLPWEAEAISRAELLTPLIFNGTYL